MKEIVNADYRTADVFRKWGINYCCSGNVTLAEACASQNVNSDDLQIELSRATTNITIPNTLKFTDWSVDFLIDYIVNIHHAYIRQAGPELQQQLSTFVTSHQKKYPYLSDVKDVAHDLIAELLEHIDTEENIMFPYIRQINYTYTRKEVYGKLFVRTLRKPLSETLDREHSRIYAQLKNLREITSNYNLVEDACTTHSVIYKKLQEFDSDLVHHKHLENNVLIPKAIQLEKELLHL